MIDKSHRTQMAAEIIQAMRAAYDELGEEGDFDDGYRYLAYNAHDQELMYEYDKWVKKTV